MRIIAVFLTISLTSCTALSVNPAAPPPGMVEDRSTETCAALHNRIDELGDYLTTVSRVRVVEGVVVAGAGITLAMGVLAPPVALGAAIGSQIAGQNLLPTGPQHSALLMARVDASNNHCYRSE